MGLSKRMKAVADMVVSGGRAAADIGCDHGYISIYLIKNKIIDKIIATDVNKAPLERAAVNIESHGLLDVIETRLSNGLSEILPKEVDTLIMAGMGGRLMARILEADIEKVRLMEQCVLQPQADALVLRRFIFKHGFNIDAEDIVYDGGKFYIVMRIRPQEKREYKDCMENPFELRVCERFGVILPKGENAVFADYLSQIRKECFLILSKIMNGHTDKSSDVKYFTDNELGRIGEVLTELEYIKLLK